jgi:arsenic resistance protein ArsH
MKDLPNIEDGAFAAPAFSDLHAPDPGHAPRILMLYGSLRARSYSRFLTMEAKRLLEAFGAEVRSFDPAGLPLPDDAPPEHPKVQELRELSAWSHSSLHPLGSRASPSTSLYGNVAKGRTSRDSANDTPK